MKRIIKILLSGLGLMILTGFLSAGVLWLRYRHIVNAEPQPMPVAARPILPGATLPFGMVRLSPETAPHP